MAFNINEPLTISPVAAQCNGACGKRSSIECVHIDRCWPQKSWRWRLRSTLNLDSDKFGCFNHRDELNSTVFLPNFRLVMHAATVARGSALVGRSPTFAGRGGRLGITRIPGFVPTAEKLQSNQIAGFKWLKWLLTASLARSVNRLVGDVHGERSSGSGCCCQ